MPNTPASQTITPTILLEHLDIASTLVAELDAITKIADPDSAVGVLARHSLSLMTGMHNDLSVAVEAL